MTEDPKKVKIELADMQFEYKKLEEDFAEFKRNAKTEKEREQKKNEEMVLKLKSALECSNEDGEYKNAKLKQEY